jgi:quercetin dioxygenase-like cupin family protein
MSHSGAALALFGVLPLLAQEDALVAAPNNYKPVYENAYVRIIRVQAKPGERSPLHRHGDLPLLEVVLSEGPSALLMEDGRRVERRNRTGDISYNPGASGPHQIENPGTAYYMAIRVELKAIPGGTQSRLPVRDPTKVDPKHYAIELDNEHFRVLRAAHAAGDRSPMHQHASRPFVMIFLGDQKWNWQSGSTRPVQRSISFGDFLYQSGGQVHGLQNMGEEFLVVELKGKPPTPPKPAPSPAKPSPAKKRPIPPAK